MRKSLAGALIRLAHRIYPPRVTVDHNIHFHPDMSKMHDYLRHWQAQRDSLNTRYWN
ncbi:hypothetical protein [Nocardia spumae]|uniref:hypothetical protein n=1 Tax=Nocardia spumae TaxID=2887190 RepID=UPI001D13ABA4|nr:hypothetical protein [Nocardia spumae]